jgi:tetratricopeptide (TPR) repeat protein
VAALAFPLAAAPGTERHPTCSGRAAQYILSGDYDRALTELAGDSAATGNEAARELNLRGLAAMMTERLEEAELSFEKALKLDPALREASLNHAVVLLKRSQFQAAVDELRPLFDQTSGPLQGRVAFHAALASDRLGRLADVRQWLSRALTSDPSYGEAILYSGLIEERTGHLQEAGTAYKRYLTIHPDDPAALLRFGLCAQRAGHADVARRYFGKVIAVAPSGNEAVEARKFMAMWE